MRQRLLDKRLLLAPGIYDGLTALLAEQAGFEALYLSGASIAYSRLGRSDLGLVTAAEVADCLGNICERVSLPVIVDADTGFGNALNVIRTVKMFERAGAAAIQLEDQLAPKRCGHLAGKALVSAAEMAGKLRAALDTRKNALIVARTDVLFIEALRSVEDMKKTAALFAGRVPLLANMVEGGKTPVLPAAELEAIGYRIAIFPGGTVRSVAFALRDYYSSLKKEGTTDKVRDRMFDFDGLNKVIGTPELLKLGKKYE